MATTTTKYILNQIKINDELKTLIANSDSEYVTATYNGMSMSLTQALNQISTGIQTNAAGLSGIDAKIAAAVSASGHAHFELVDSLPDVSNAEENVLYLVRNESTGFLDIYAKIKSGDDYSLEQLDDTTVDVTNKADKDTDAVSGNIAAFDSSGNPVDSGIKAGSSALADSPDENTLATEAAVSAALAQKAGLDTATASSNGLMSASDKSALDSFRGVRVGSTVPDDMQNGEIFVLAVEETNTEDKGDGDLAPGA